MKCLDKKKNSFYDFRVQEDSFGKTSKAQTIKGKCDIFDYIKMKNLSTKEDTRIKRKMGRRQGDGNGHTDARIYKSMKETDHFSLASYRFKKITHEKIKKLKLHK